MIETKKFGFWNVDELNLHKGFFLLPELSVIEVSGADAITFVHGQLTNHIKNLGQAFRMAAYCQPKGRILSLMRVYQNNDKLYLLMPTELIGGFMKRFSMFILRSKVLLRVADELCVLGLVDQFFDLPEVDQIQQRPEGILARLHDVQGHTRCLFIGSKNALGAYTQTAEKSDLWFAGEVLSQTPWVGENTKEAFVPQWINLDLIGGVVFDKGCYPGQEVIARVQHIGETPRRMRLAKASQKLELMANEEVFQNDLPIGSVVMGVSSTHETLVLCQINLNACSGNVVQIHGVDFSLL